MDSIKFKFSAKKADIVIDSRKDKENRSPGNINLLVPVFENNFHLGEGERVLEENVTKNPIMKEDFNMGATSREDVGNIFGQRK